MNGSRSFHSLPAIAMGAVAVALTFALAELLAAVGFWAGILTRAAAPFRSWGEAFIAITPEWLKELAISLFGQQDKLALAVGIVITAVVLAVVVGMLARWRRWAALTLGALGIVATCVAILSRPAASALDIGPTLIGGAIALWYLARATQPDETAVTTNHDDARAPGEIDGNHRVLHHDDAHHDDDRPGRGATAGARPMLPSRRDALRLTGVGALGAIAAGAASRFVPAGVNISEDRAKVSVLQPVPPLPSRINPDVPGLTPYVTPTGEFYRVDTAFILPRLATSNWRLRVHGLVDEPFEITWQELTAMPQVERWITLACVSNPVGGSLVGNAAWQGVRLADVLQRAKPHPGADCVLSSSVDHFTVSTPLSALTDGRDALLAIGMNGQPLPVAHGYPVRMVVPGLYGYVSATKWVTDLEVTKFADVTAFWTERGWSDHGPIKMSSRIDRPGRHAHLPDDMVAVAGVAWAPHRGISAVEVQVDDDDWRRAEIFGAASSDTWRQWVFRWDTSGVAPGEHRLRCRAIDGDGTVQPWGNQPVVPDGATGYHEIPVTVA